MHRRRMCRLVALTLCCAAAAVAGPQPASAGAASGRRDQVAALRLSAKWITLYAPRFWVAVETPGACAAQPDGTRRCPIAIVIKARVGETLVDHRCVAHAILPRGDAKAEPRRTSARCAPDERWRDAESAWSSGFG